MVGKRVLFQKAVFDCDSITLAYKGDVNFFADDIKLGSSFNRNHYSLSDMEVTIPPTTSVYGQQYHVVTVPHNLQLISQQVQVSVYYEGAKGEFTIFFPGDKIAQSTTEGMFDPEGRETTDRGKAYTRAVVGVNYILVETKTPGNIRVLDKTNGSTPRESFNTSAAGKLLTVFGPLRLPRNKPEIKLDTWHKTILIMKY